MSNKSEQHSAIHKHSHSGKSIVVIILAVIILITSLLSVLNVITNDIWNIITFPALAIITLINGLATYRTDKKTGIFILICAIVIILAAIATLIVTLFV